MRISRRSFLRGAGAAMTAWMLPGGLARRAGAQATDPVLVTVFLRGGADGLALVIPGGDPVYYDLRPGIGIPENELIDLDGFFGLPADLADLAPAYHAGDLAFVHCAGSPDDTRSHFRAQDFMDRAAPGDLSVTDGWLNRLLTEIGSPDVWTGITLGASSRLSLEGPAPHLGVPSVIGFDLRANWTEDTLEAMYAAGSFGNLSTTAAEAFEAVEVLQGIPTTSAAPYPGSPFATSLREAAALIRANVGVRAISIDLGGWDFHARIVKRQEDLLTMFAASIAAFYQDLGTDLSRTLLLGMTEFGRNAGENGSLGTDHGKASVMFALGGGVSGGQVLLKNDTWPGLTPEALHEGRDLPVTTDFRDVFVDVARTHMGVSDLSSVLPGFPVSPGPHSGLFG
jgi:uncharacterized protein (DUF1501 family)